MGLKMIKQDAPALVPTTRRSSDLCMATMRLPGKNTGISLESSCDDAKSQLSKALTHKHMCTVWLYASPCFYSSPPWLSINLFCLLLSQIFLLLYNGNSVWLQSVCGLSLVVGLQWLHVQCVCSNYLNSVTLLDFSHFQSRRYIQWSDCGYRRIDRCTKVNTLTIASEPSSNRP